MSDIVSLDAAARRKAKAAREANREKARGRTLCKRGFHQWGIDQKKQFDVRQGKLVTVRRCSRCGASRTTLD
jgi:hypothetical protein